MIKQRVFLMLAGAVLTVVVDVWLWAREEFNAASYELD